MLQRALTVSGGGIISPTAPQAVQLLYGTGGHVEFTFDPSKKYILTALETNGTYTNGGIYYINGSATLILDNGASSFFNVSTSGTTLALDCGSWLGRYFPVALVQLD